MPFRRHRAPEDCITSDALAQFGRSEILGAELSGVPRLGVYQLVEPLAVQTYTDDGIGTTGVLEELRRHGDKGEWEAVGGWKFVREFVRDPEVTGPDVIDKGLEALARMRITNLGLLLAFDDRSRYEILTGAPVPNDGFFGPPTFESEFGPTRQFYFDDAISFARSRQPQRLPHSPGVDPIRVDDVAKSMWDFGLLVFRGPLVVGPDGRFEPSLVRTASEVAKGVDHHRFVDRLCGELFEGEMAQYAFPWSVAGAGRFVEDYLDVSLTGSPGHERLVDSALANLLEVGAIGLQMTPEVLSTFEWSRLRLLQSHH